MGAVVVEVVSTACRRSWKEARLVWHFIQALCIDVVAYSHSRTLSYSPAQVSERTRAPLQSSLLPNLSLSLSSLSERLVATGLPFGIATGTTVVGVLQALFLYFSLYTYQHARTVFDPRLCYF